MSDDDDDDDDILASLSVTVVAAGVRLSSACDDVDNIMVVLGAFMDKSPAKFLQVHSTTEGHKQQ